MAGRQESLEAIVATLHRVEALHEQGQSVIEALRQVGVTECTYRRWHRLYGGLDQDEVRWMKQLLHERRWLGATLH